MSTRARILVAGHDFGGLNLLAPLLRAWQQDPRFAAEFVSTPAVCREMSAQVPGLRFPGWASSISTSTAVSPAATGTSSSAAPVG